MSYRVEVYAEGEWVGNGLRFPTDAEADSRGRDVLSTWFSPTVYRVVISDAPANYNYIDHKLVRIETPEEA